MTEAYYWVAQNEGCPAYACKADVKASNLQKLEAWLTHLYPNIL